MKKSEYKEDVIDYCNKKVNELSVLEDEAAKAGNIHALTMYTYGKRAYEDILGFIADEGGYEW